MEEILRRPVDVSQDQPGDRDDNLWVTIDQYEPPATEEEWQETCFLDKPYHGYYQWPKVIRYSLNKRERYVEGKMPEEVALIYRRFVDQEFLRRSIQWMVDGERSDHSSFDLQRFRMFKVKRNSKRAKGQTSLPPLLSGPLPKFRVNLLR